VANVVATAKRLLSGARLNCQSIEFVNSFEGFNGLNVASLEQKASGRNPQDSSRRRAGNAKAHGNLSVGADCPRLPTLQNRTRTNVERILHQLLPLPSNGFISRSCLLDD